jgi:hypothetical protein
LRLLDQSVDIVVGQTGGDHARPRCPSTRNQLVRLDPDGDAIVRVFVPIFVQNIPTRMSDSLTS